MPGSSLIGNLAVTLGLDTAAFQRGATLAEKRTEAMRTKFAGMGKTIAGVGAALGAGILINGLTSAASGAFDMASALSEAAEKAGVTVEALQELRFAAEQNGVSTETLETALVKLTRSMGDLQLGKKSAVDAFAAIGLAAADLKGKSVDQTLAIVADRLNQISDPATRVAIGAQLMGRNFAQLLPLINGGSKALEDYAEQARKNGIITAEEARVLDESADAWDRTKLKIQVATAKIIAAFAATEQIVYKWYEFRDGIVAAAGELSSKAVKYVNDMVTGIGQAITGRLEAIWNGAKKKIEQVKAAFFQLYDAVVGHSYVPDMVEGIAAEMAKLDAVMVQPATAATSKTAEAFRQLQQATQGLLSRLFPEAAAFNQFQSEMATLNAAMEKGILKANEYAEAVRRLQGEFAPDAPIDVLSQGSLVTESNDQLGSIVDNTREWQQATVGVGRNLANIAQNLLGRLADGSLKLKDIWKELAVMAIQAFAGGGGSSFGSLFGGGLASGGPVNRNKFYMVGENGPELFAPGVSGRIIANDDSRRMMSGGGTQNFYFPNSDYDSFRRNQTQMARDARRRIGVNG